MFKCKFRKKCKLYRENSNTCNKWCDRTYCGKYRELMGLTYISKVLMVLFIGMFMISFASALDWDNKLEYENENMTVKFSNSFLGIIEIGDIGTVELKSHKSVNEIREVFAGNDIVVMYYDFDFKKLYKNGLGEVEFVNVKTGERVEKNYSFVYWGNKTRLINDYEECINAYNKVDLNAIGTDQCSDTLDEEYEKKYETWIEYDSLDIPSGDIRIGLAVDSIAGEYIDGIWTISGKKVSKHAAWIVSYAAYDNINLSTQDASPFGMFFKPDGTKLYEVGSSSDLFYQYSCSSAWNLSSCSYDSVSLSTQDSDPHGMFFKPDGTKLYEVGYSNLFYQYSCSSAWNLSSCSYDSVNLSTQDTLTSGMFFKPDGTKLYEVGSSSNLFYQYSCSSAWNLSSCSYDSVSLSTQDTGPSGMFFKPDGTKLYEVGFGSDLFYQYSCSSAWNLSSCSYDSVSLSTQDTFTSGMFFKPDGTKLYEVGSSSDLFYQYTITSIIPNIILISPINNTYSNTTLNDFSCSAEAVNSTGLLGGSINITNFTSSEQIYTNTIDYITNSTYMIFNWTDVSLSDGEYNWQCSADWGQFRSSTILAKDTARDNHGVVSGATFNRSSGPFGDGGFEFDGVDDYVNTTITDNSDFTNGFTLSTWISPLSDGEVDNARILDKSDGTSGQNGFRWNVIGTSSTGRAQFSINNGAVISGQSGDINMDGGGWQHVLVTVSSSQIVQHYVNGVASGSSGDAVQPLSSITTTNPLTIGNRAGATDRTFDGSISSVRVFDRVLNSTEIAALNATNTILNRSGLVAEYLMDEEFREYIVETTTAIDQSGNGNNGTLNGGMELNESAVRWGFRGGNFDGVDDYIDVPSSNVINDSWTISFWGNQKSYLSTAGLIDKYVTASGQRGFRILTTSTNEIELTLSSDGNSGEVESSINDCGFDTNNEWTLITLILNETKLDYYKDGEYCDTDTYTSQTDGIFQTPVDMWFGRGRFGDAHFNGSIDDVRIFNRTLSQAEITQLYTSNNISNETGLVAYYDMEETFTTTNTSRKLTVDTTDPNVTILYPENTSYTTAVTTLNFTLTEINQDTCWYSTNDSVNITTSCSANVTGLSANEGSNTWTVYANDSAGNEGSDSVTFFVDTINPNVTIDYPVNGTYYDSAQTQLNYTVNETNPGFCWYSTDGGTTNSSAVTAGQNFTLSSTEGQNNWTVYCNDTLGLEDSDSVTFFVDTTQPVITILYPQNTTYNINVSQLNYSITDANPDKCWYSTDGGATNSSAVTAGQNFTGVISSEGSNTWTVYCNDTLGNSNSSAVTFTKETLFVTLNSPADNYTALVPVVEFNCSANTTDGVVLSNISLYTNESGTWEIKNSTTIPYYTNWTQTWSRTINDTTLWTCQACDFDNDCKFANDNRTVFVDATIPQINVETPTGTLDYNYIGGPETLNVTFTDSNLDSCWYNYNGTNITIEGCLTGVKNSTTFVLEEDNYNMTIYANDTVGNENSTFISWRYEVLEINQTYSSTTFETSEEEFLIWIEYNSSKWSSISGQINYNGTNYSATVQTSGELASFTANIQIPEITSSQENLTFYWVISLSNDSGSADISTASNNQTVSEVLLSICNASETPYIIFNTVEAENPFPDLNATFKSAWLIGDEGSENLLLNFSYEDITEQNNTWRFCISPNTSNYSISVDVEADATGYSKNFYYISGADYIANQTTNVTLYLLNDSLSTATTLLVRDRYQRVIEDALIFIQLYDVGTDLFYTVTMGKTNQNGEDIVWLNWYDSLYKFIIVENGTTTLSTNPYKVGETPQIFQVEDEIVYDFDKFRDFEYSLYFNNATNNFVLTYVKPSALVESGCLRVIKRTALNDTQICQTCSTSSSATLYCNIASSGNGTFIATFYATGSLSVIEWITHEVGFDIADTIFDLLDKDDAAFYTILMTTLVLLLFLISPVFGILGLLGGLLISSSLGFSLISYGTFLFISCVGGTIIWLLKK